MSNGYESEALDEYDEAINTFETLESDYEGDEERLPWRRRRRTKRPPRLDPGQIPQRLSPARYETAMRRTESQFSNVSSDMAGLNARSARLEYQIRRMALSNQITAAVFAVQQLTAQKAKLLDSASPPNEIEVNLAPTGFPALLPLVAVLAPFFIGGGMSTKTGQSTDFLTSAAVGFAGGLAANKLVPKT